MKNFKLNGTATAIALILPASTAFADVSAAQVWGDMKTYMQDFGYTVSGDERVDGNALILENTMLSMALPDGAGNFSVTTGTMTLTDKGDGTVDVSMPASLPMTFNINVEGDPVSGRINYDQTGFVMTVSGDPDDMTYTYAANSLAMSLAELVVDGEAAPADMIRAVVTLNKVSGFSQMIKANLRNISQSMSIGSMDYDINVAPPKEGRFVMSGSAQDLSFSGTTAIPFQMDLNDMASAIKAGFAVDGTFQHKGGKTDFLFQEDDETVSGSSSTSAGSFGFVINDKRLRYQISGDDMAMFFQGGDIPFPVNLQMAKTLFDLAIPVSKDADTAQDFSLAVTLGEFEMSDILWSIIDGAAILPRDPATISMDIAGTAKLLLDFMDPQEMAMVEEGVMPAELETLTLNNLLVQAAGAKIAGDGAFTFDNTDTETFDGMPRPQGALNISVNGANGLIDKLVQMGLVQDEQAMGARMMMSMFAVPGDGEDALKSKIEVNEQGHVLANGQRLR